MRRATLVEHPKKGEFSFPLFAVAVMGIAVLVLFSFPMPANAAERDAEAGSAIRLPFHSDIPVFWDSFLRTGIVDVTGLSFEAESPFASDFWNSFFRSGFWIGRHGI